MVFNQYIANTQVGRHVPNVQLCCNKYHCVRSVVFLARLNIKLLCKIHDIILISITRALIGVCKLMYSYFARQISFEIDEFKFDLKRNL